MVASDDKLADTTAKVSTAASKVSFSWVTGEMLAHVVMSTGLAAVVYASHSYFGYPLSTGAFLQLHMLFGVVLGLLLVGRIILGTARIQAAASHVQEFSKGCRQVAVLSTFVVETLTVSAGAEVEKKAIGHFRFELVRLLNYAVYCFMLMMEGKKLAVPPSSLQRIDSGAAEAKLSAVNNPTVMVCKMIAALLEQQSAAKRISNEQVSVLMNKVSDIIEAYHQSLALALAPTATAFASFTYTFTTIFVYTAGPLIAVNELESNTPGSFGLGLTVFYTLMLALFYFGLLEAGKLLDAPISALAGLLAIEEMVYVLSDDLASIVDDDSVPVFLHAGD